MPMPLARAPGADPANGITWTDTAPQHKPRPLPLFLDLLRSETAAWPSRLTAALAGLRLYQSAARPPRPAPMPTAAAAGRAVLRDYGGDGPPLVVVPSLINPPDILDLDAGRSLLRWLAKQGVRPLLVDWGQPEPAGRALSIAGHVETLLLPLIGSLGEPPLLAGYCLGGTMALAAGALTPVRGLVTIAAPWRFSGFPDEARTGMRTLWEQALPVVEQLGLLPMELLQTAFWKLDPASTIGKFERLVSLAGDGEALRTFVTLEDWANDGPPLTEAAGRELVEAMFGTDMTGAGRWTVGGRRIAPARLGCPLLDIVSATDRIVPQASAHGAGTRLTLGLGHVGMIVGGRARASLWEPLARWLSVAGRT